MPDPDQNKNDRQRELDLNSIESTAEPALPPLSAPRTAAPFNFNQQVNIQQIPTRAWDKLSSEQIVELTKAIITRGDDMDRRQFQYAMETVQQSMKLGRFSLIAGGIVALCGFSVATYLVTTGHETSGAVLLTFLASTIAHVVGSRASK